MTVNPTSGCDGCELWLPNGVKGPCYAGALHESRLAKNMPDLYDPDFNRVRLIPGRVEKSLRCMDLTGKDRPQKPWLNGLRRKVFAGDLGDVFSKAVPFEYVYSELIETATTKNGSRHDLQLLTKQPARAVAFSAWLTTKGVKWPDNVWLGVSVTGKASLSRIKHLVATPAKIKYLSMEPLVEWPELTAAHLNGISWVIVGGESDQGEHEARPFELDWARKTIALCKEAGISPFVKQLGSRPVDGTPLTLADRHGGDWSEWPEDLRIRRMPDSA